MEKKFDLKSTLICGGEILLIIVIYKLAMTLIELIATPIYRKIGWLADGEKLTVTSEFTLSNVIAYTIGILIALFGYYLIVKTKKAKLFKYTSMDKFSPKFAIVAAIFGFCVNVTVMYVMMLGKENDTLGNIYKEYLKTAKSGSVWIMLVFVGFLIPVFEELIYRGLIFNIIREKASLGVSIALQAILFVVFEMIVGGSQFSIVESSYGFVMAVAFALFYYWSGSLWSSIFARSFKNLAALIIVAFIDEKLFISCRYIFMTLTFVGIIAAFVGMAIMGKKNKAAIAEKNA